MFLLSRLFCLKNIAMSKHISVYLFRLQRWENISDIIKRKLNFGKNRSILNFYFISLSLEKNLPQNDTNASSKITIR